MGINVLSLFDGKSSGYTALELNGVTPDNYYSAEIDKYAIQVSNAIHPNQIRLGDVTKWKEWDIDWGSIDIVMGGFPCQSWSVAGKQKGDKDPRGMLFWVMLDIIKHVRKHNPKAHFLMENVKMKKDFEEYITNLAEDALGCVHKILIVSALVSAQRRKRYYWTSWENTQPKDRGIILRDILDGDVEVDAFEYCDEYKNVLQLNIKPLTKQLEQFKAVPLSSVIKFGDSYVQYDISGKGYASQDQRAHYLNGKMGTLAAHRTDSKTNTLFAITRDYILYRKLSVRECYRLQTVPDHLIDKILSCGVSSTQLYKIAGNGWTDEVIAHLLKPVINELTNK